ncbi:hypothetical protein BFJ68_g3514 [Fusarium oxysporum]|uniref:Uncharacterized protein n=2 Tax=Fusarium oxysporum TaxID=5507 RepID=A0A420RQF0_FUSOX|nr:hypothetical protein BFJ65_g17353 [Fusarium oxysporum f. sp. cepae]RKK36551.1 hypothetical protein BFJ66_g13432 [Fusarium oxysporum f. sp. cepae]RKK41165.1 hypothetical protein BFJ67_g10652 [Fusarium oxysporum f. sp. cepae]RKL11659.1 hypothetical protein BFJ71_g142 [Fusarium oxysporum]RKL19240.1 hypothetical protein BFJ68_g3514 [Fusarium oxysporum]
MNAGHVTALPDDVKTILGDSGNLDNLELTSLTEANEEA